MQNILILTDFSENSWNSLKYALALFQNKSCNFHLLHAMNNHNEEFNGVGYNRQSLVVEKNTNNLKKEFKKLLDNISATHLKGNHTFIPTIAEADIIEAARLHIAKKNIDLVVIGTNGMSSDGRINNISQTSEDIITKLKSSILVVPIESRFKGLKEIAFPTDYTNFYEAKLLQNITNLLSYHESPISFVYMTKKTSELDKEQCWNKETLQDYFKEQPHSFHVEINENFEVSIENFVDKKGVDLIVMAAKNLNLFEQILFRPQIKNIKYYFNTPFLVLHQFN